MKIKAALFDLDGVIIDTETQYSRFWGEQCRHYFPDQPGLENVIKGQTLVQIYDHVFADLPDEQPLITERLNAYEQQMSYDYIAGAREFIESLRRQGIKTAIVTSSNQPKMKNVHRSHPELSELFDAILTAEDFTESKTHPQCYLRAAQRLVAGMRARGVCGLRGQLQRIESRAQRRNDGGRTGHHQPRRRHQALRRHRGRRLPAPSTRRRHTAGHTIKERNHRYHHDEISKYHIHDTRCIGLPHGMQRR